MNTKRFLFWGAFIIILGLIVWGLVVAMNKPINSDGAKLGQPAEVTAADHVEVSSTALGVNPANAPVTMIEYSDFQCPACESYYYVIERVLASTTVPVRFVYRHFPLSQHPNAIPAALASEAASQQGKFWEMYRLLFGNPTEWTGEKDPTAIFMGYASELGLDVVKFKADMASSSLKALITKSSDDGLKIGINSTPTFFINGKAITNPTTDAEFKSIIEEAAKGNTQ